MVLKESIFSIPIYICSEHNFQNKKAKEKFSGIKSTFSKYEIESKFDFKIDSWKYNKIIGWIVIYLNGKTLKANLWFVDANRIGIKLRNRNLIYVGKIGDVSITHQKSNLEIASDIKAFFKNCQQGAYVKKLKRRFIDTSELYKILEFLDLKKMITNLAEK